MTTRKRKTAAAVPARRKKASSKRSTSSRKKTTAAAVVKPPKLGIVNHPCSVVSVYGPFGNRTLVDMPTDWVEIIFKEIGRPPSPSRVIDAVSLEMEKLRKVDAELADSALAATALALAFELDHPGNSATSKSMCARALNETMDKIRALAPPADEKDGVDELSQAREKRRAAVVNA